MAEQRKENPMDELFYEKWFDLACREDKIRAALSELKTKLPHTSDPDEAHDLDRSVFELEQESNWLREADKQLEERYEITRTVGRRGEKVLAGAREGGRRKADKKKLKYPNWQKLGAEIWSKNTRLSRLAVAKKISKSTGDVAETTRRHIQKPT